MTALTMIAAIAMIATVAAATAEAQDTDVLASWRQGVSIRPVTPDTDAHTIHSYFNTCPESPDGKYVLYFRSTTSDAQRGQVCIIERATGKQSVLADDITVTDAHTVASQQWVSGGKRVVYRCEVDGHWLVMCVDVDGTNRRVLARDRLAGFGQPHADIVPLFGPYWRLTEHRDLDLLNVVTGEITPGVSNDTVRAAYPDWVKQNFGDRPTSIFFGILSPDLKRVIFKLSTPASGEIRSSESSTRDGLIVYDFEQKKCLTLQEKWGHPAWHVDSRTLIQMRNALIDTDTGISRTIPGIPDYWSSHPTSSPDGKLILKDMAVPQPGVPANQWTVKGIDLCDINGSHELIIHQFEDGLGAKSWRRPHPHPVFSADGKRIYYNVSSDQWTRLFVAERVDAK